MFKFNTIAALTVTGTIGYGFYHQQMENATLHKKIEALIDSNSLTHDSLLLETQNRKKMMAFQTQENTLFSEKNTQDQIAKLQALTDKITKPIYMWNGGTYGHAKEDVYRGEYTLETCNQECVKKDWCVTFEVGHGTAAGVCAIFGKGAVKSGPYYPYHHYKVVNPDSPVTKRELSEFSNDLISTLKEIVGQVADNQDAFATQATKDDHSIKALETASHTHSGEIRANTESFGTVKNQITGNSYIVNSLAAHQKKLEETVDYDAHNEHLIIQRFNHIKSEISDLKENN